MTSPMRRRDCWLLLPALLLPGMARASSKLGDRVRTAQKRHAEAIAGNDARALADFYQPDARSLPEYQPALWGQTAIQAYHEVLFRRRPVSRYEAETLKVIDLGRNTVFEIGTFDIVWGGSHAEPGKYVNVWGIEPDGNLRLKADAWGYFRPLPDPQNFYVDLPHSETRKPSVTDPLIGRQLDELNRRNAEAVRTKDAETQIGFYTDDALMMPFADASKSGIDSIAAHLRRYVQNGSGATFDTVEVWNEGFEVFDAHIIEYSRFRVRWRAGDASGVTSGGGIRLWRRMADGQLKMLCQIGTHYHNAQ